MKTDKRTITIDKQGYNLVARDESGLVLACVKTNCNPSAIWQIIYAAELLGEIDWAASQVVKPDERIEPEEDNEREAVLDELVKIAQENDMGYSK